MVSKEELEDILHKEEVKAIWKSIDQKKLRKAEKEREWYLNYTQKEYHPISYQVKKEVEEWERKEPLFQWNNDRINRKNFGSMMLISFWFIIGLILVKAILL